jgi:hypothetical protein
MVNHLKVFGSICYAHVPKEMRHQIEDKCEKYVFIGYSTKSNGYTLFSLKRNKVIESRDVIFNEKNKWDWKNKDVKSMLVQIRDDAREVSNGGSYENNEEEEQPYYPTINIGSRSSSPSSTPIRLRRLSYIYETCNFCVVEPECFEQVTGVEVWRNIMEDEIKMIVKNEI